MTYSRNSKQLVDRGISMQKSHVKLRGGRPLDADIQL